MFRQLPFHPLMESIHQGPAVLLMKAQPFFWQQFPFPRHGIVVGMLVERGDLGCTSKPGRNDEEGRDDDRSPKAAETKTIHHATERLAVDGPVTLSLSKRLFRKQRDRADHIPRVCAVRKRMLVK